ncbi:sugar phosphate isomerase/epimerase family protein [Ferdinandcohnia quinoae]|uniref:Sugar phosphate isomerase/epimerase n=1 Tax=Fredinandcohnia quinoae TaxID=2918902 RepID=A0AAW5DTV8_9BACI|nr:sugar phosphate isomerase/epimerase family protein [Fredinandcohnia sp. SECRCQ15]MCH1624077.1 sugar phosphate isomerase/epimerase [Fredinandcohnia sp. SECRCQ15]
MKNVISSYTMIHMPIEQTIHTLLKNNWKVIEIMCEGHGYEMLSWDQTRRNNLRYLLNDCGATINFHAPITDFNPAIDEMSIRIKTNEVWNRCMELVDFFGSEYVLFHPGRSSNHEKGLMNIQNYFHGKSSEVPNETLLILENVPPYENEIGTSASELISIIELIKNRNVGVCFDSGHAFLSNRASFGHELKVLEPYIKVFHLNDNHGLSDEHLAIGDGEIPFELIIQVLKKARENYFVNFEMKTVEFANKSVESLQRQL